MSEVENYRYFQEKFTDEKLKNIMKGLKTYRALERHYLKKFDGELYQDSETKDLLKQIKKYKKSMLDDIFVVIVKKFKKRIGGQNEKIVYWNAFIKQHLSGILKDYFAEELWQAKSFDDSQNPESPENIGRIRRIKDEIKELEYISKSEEETLTEKESRRLDKLRQDYITIKTITVSPGTGILESDDEDYKDPFSRKSEDYIDVIELDKKKKESKAHLKERSTSPELKTVFGVDFTAMGKRKHLSNAEERYFSEKRKEIFDIVEEVCDPREFDILRLLYTAELTFEDITFFIEPEDGRKITFRDSVDFDFFINELKTHARTFETEIWLSLDNTLKSNISKRKKLNKNQKAEILNLMDEYFKMKLVFSHEELASVGLYPIMIKHIFKKDPAKLPPEETLKFNLLALRRIYHIGAEGSNIKTVKGLISKERVFQLSKRANKKLRESGKVDCYIEG